MTGAAGIPSATIDDILTSPRLPTLPAVAIEILGLIARDDVSLHELTRVLSTDPALCAKLLKSANSSYFGVGRQVRDVEGAVHLLGLRGVKTLALGFSLVGQLRKADPGALDHVRFWRQSLITAALARRFAAATPPGERDAAYLGGLLHALGVLVLHQVYGARYAALARSTSGYWQLQKHEQREFGFDYLRVGALLAARWNLPETVAACIRFHHRPESAGAGHRRAATCVAAAAAVGDLSAGDKAAARRFLAHCRALGLSAAAGQALVAEAGPELEQLGSVVDFQELDTTDLLQVIESAHGALAALSAQGVEREIVLAEERDQMAVVAGTDVVTGLMNRWSFDGALAAHVRIARRDGSPLSVLLIDIDTFKDVNNTYGHLVGDAVLRSVAASIQQACREADRPFRVGGDEFALILPHTAGDEAVVVAERLRQQVAACTVEVGSAGFSLAVSVGVAEYDADRHRSMEALVGEADARLYEAKRSGRNRISWLDTEAAPAARRVA